MKTPRLEIFQSVISSRWHWRLRARNGQIIADGGEGYQRRAGARRAAETVRRTFRAAILCVRSSKL